MKVLEKVSSWHFITWIRSICCLEGWCTVIVFDKKTPAAAYNNGITSNRLVFVAVEMQLKFLKDSNLNSVEVNYKVQPATRAYFYLLRRALAFGI